jgi:hypothetical protein
MVVTTSIHPNRFRRPRSVVRIGVRMIDPRAGGIAGELNRSIKRPARVARPRAVVAGVGGPAAAPPRMQCDRPSRGGRAGRPLRTGLTRRRCEVHAGRPASLTTMAAARTPGGDHAAPTAHLGCRPCGAGSLIIADGQARLGRGLAARSRALRRPGRRGAGRRPALVWPFGVRANARDYGSVRADAASVGGRPAPHQGVRQPRDHAGAIHAAAASVRTRAGTGEAGDVGGVVQG